MKCTLCKALVTIASQPQCASSSFLAFIRQQNFNIKSATIKTNNLLCVKAIHAVNAALWHPGKQTQKSQTNRKTDRQTNVEH